MKKTIFTLALATGVLLTGCKEKQQKSPTPSTVTEIATEYKPNADNKIILGKQIENPYSVSNMSKAYARLSSNARLSADASPVRTTHLYVRFLPKTWAEYDTLVADTSLELYNIPLDYEITTCGNFYQDPSIPEGSPTWQYTSVPVDFTFNPSIKHEILEELYIPEQDPALVGTGQRREAINGKSFTDALLDEAFVLTKNYDDTLRTRSKVARTTWNPSGTIRVLDTRLQASNINNGYVPLQGVKIRCRRWVVVKIAEATTDANGWYQTSSFDRPVNYSLIFETGAFDVRTGTFGQATVDGPKSSSAWNIDFYVDDVNRFYCHVFRGAYRYHYGNIDGLKRPNVWSKLKYCCYDGENSEANGDFWGNWDPTGIFPDIRIWGKIAGKFKDSDQIFSTTVHETAHASHAQLLNDKGIGMAVVNNKIVESWAVAVQWRITAMEYRGRGIPTFADENYTATNIFRLKNAYQFWTNANVGTNYTSLFIDLVDDFNQYGVAYPSYGVSTVNDNVKGYTLAGIESTFLFNVTGIDTWIGSLRGNLKANKPTGVTDAQIDNLLTSF